MSENTAIAWTTHTLNLISGCSKISAGCTFCYAAALPPAMRRHAEWGPTGERKFAPESYIAQVYGWQRRAEKTGIRERVFGPSVADPFEGAHGPGGESRDGPRPDYLPVLDRMFAIAAACPMLDFQVLTKRPWNAVAWWRRTRPVWPRNLWIGTSTEDQRAADERVPYLLQLPAAVRFLSCEPLLGKVDLRLWLNDESEDVADDSFHRANADDVQAARGIQWVIVGGESGRNARDMSPGWAALILEDCRVANVPVFMKQMGSVWAEVNGAAHKKGGDPNEWAPAFRVQEFPDVRDV
jgi:protein gp37